MKRTFPIKLTGTRQLPAELVWSMWYDYNLPMSLSAVERKYGRTRGAVREIFVKRGLKVRQHYKPPAYDPLTGRILKLPPATPEQITAMIDGLNKIKVPDALKREWRQWSWEKRGKFLARLRKKFRTEHDRPETPFSSNVQPWDYTTPLAHEIERRENAGISGTRITRVKIKVTSYGVIWRDGLYFWTGKGDWGYGYQSGTSGPYQRRSAGGNGRAQLHHLIWEDHNKRKVPAHYTVVHIDGNKNNLLPENLTLKHREVCLRENQAKSLQKKARAMTALLLRKHQSKGPHENTDIVKTLASQRGRTNYGQHVRS